LNQENKQKELAMNFPDEAQKNATRVEDAYPLSAMQQGMLFHSLLAPGSGVDIEQLVCELHEALEVTALQRSWQCVLARHPVLRTNFRWQGLNEPQQEVHSVVELPWEAQDWRDLPPDEKEKRSAAFLMADRRRGFDLTQSPLLRLTLFRWDDAHSRLIWTFHHALLDGRSFAPLLREVFTFYEAFRQGEEMELPLPRPYRDYIDWLQRQDFSRSEAFWRQTLKGFTAPTPLVVDHTPGTGGDEGTHQDDQEIWLSTEITTTLRSLAKENQLTLNTVVQGAWALLLSRYSGEADVVFGATRACRRSSVEGAEQMVGLFINTLPVRVHVNPKASLLPWLKELRAQWVAMREHEHTPLVKVQGWSEVPGGVSLFESIVVFENFHLDTLLRTQGGSWSNRQFRLFEKTNYPITLEVYAGAELCLKIGFDRSRFDDATVARMLGHLGTLLEVMAGQPQQRLGDYQLLTPAERHKLLVEWNATRADYPEDKCIHELFEAQVERTPDAIAVVFEESRLTYRELNRRANQLAHRLRKMGVQSDTLVGICVERSLEMVVGLLGILKAGGAYVPLDPSYPKERLKFMLEDARPLALLTQRKLQEVLPSHQARVVYMDASAETGAEIEHGFGAELKSRSNCLAYVLYTSGSTGRPKGVAIEHRSAVAFATWARRVFTDEEFAGVLFSTSICFDLSVFELFVTLGNGGKVILAKNALELPTLPAANEVRMINTVPSAIAELARTNGIPRSVITVNLAGEPLAQSLVDKLYADCFVHRVYDLYGPTEATTYSTFTLRQRGGKATIGRPISNTHIYILDRHLRPVPIGVPGELYIGGDGLARGYLNRPELTAEKFIPDPFITEPGARLYRTGDLARFLPDGNIEYLGRLDHQVKIRGFRIELGEIESVLGGHPAVREAVVVVREDVPGDKRLVAYLTAKEGEPANVSELRDLLQTKLPEYMVPSAFVTLDRFPLTPNGKVDRKALPMPDLARPELEKAFVAPRTSIERVLADIWGEVLGLKQIGVHDNFFDLGGHSLLAIRLQARVEKHFGRRAPLAALFQAPTVSEFAKLLADAATPVEEMLLVTPRSSSGQQPLFCFHFLDAAQRLKKHLRTNWAVYGVESPLYEELRLWHEHRRLGISVEDVARRCLTTIRQVQPHGPYYLTGFCFGGVLAFEVASQLTRLGERVAFLGLVDAYYSPGCKPKSMPWMRRWIYHARRISQVGFTYLSTKVRTRLALQKRRRSQLNALRSANRPPGDSETERMRLPEANFLGHLLRPYRAKPYAGNAVLIRNIGDPSFGFDPGAANGWDHVIQGDLQVEELVCGHMDIAEEPHIIEVAKRLENYLLKADAGLIIDDKVAAAPSLGTVQAV
jgi:amino acid adenylation domain-containing protein